MKLLVLLALCGAVTLTPMQMKSTTLSANEKVECEPQTPCGWATYNPYTRMILSNISNSYCVCPADLFCVVSEDDTSVNGYIRRCRTKDAELDVSAR